MNNNNLTELRTLIDKLNYYTKLYDEGHPEITDEEYDNLYFKLQSLETKYNTYCEDSPTQRIDYQIVNKLNKVEHNHPMLSLDKTKDIDEIRSFLGNRDSIVMAKMDGLTCSLKYLNGKLVSAETRGNGLVGEDVLHNALQIHSIPKKIPYQGELIVDGEIICTYSDFELFENEYKNPRNFASGSIRLLDSKECAMRRLTFVAWDCITDLEYTTSLSQKLMQLEGMNFIVVPYIEMITNFDLNNCIKGIKDICQQCSYPIDGVVFKYNNLQEYAAAGRTDHHFKGGMAYKFYDEEYETHLLYRIYDGQDW